MADPIRVTVLGHSFVRRAHKFTQDKQIDNLYLPPEHFTLQMLGQGGANWSDLMDMFERCSSEPELVIIDIGTNDLAGVTQLYQAHQVVVNVFQVARTLISRGVSRVIVLQVLPRSSAGRYADPLFSNYAHAYNDCMKMLIYQSKSSVPIFFWYHSGMSYKADPFLSDGLHLNEAGNYKYIRSIKRAVLKHRPALRPTQSMLQL